jgi:hypothetical protein
MTALQGGMAQSACPPRTTGFLSRLALVEFARHDNNTWLVARHGYKTADQVRAEQLSVAKGNFAELLFAA